MQNVMPYDSLGDSLGVLENLFEDSTEVVNLYATDTYREFVEMMYQWNQEGLIMPDATTTTENNLLSGNGFFNHFKRYQLLVPHTPISPFLFLAV